LRLLLDTHILLWAVTASPKTSERARALVTDSSNQLYASAASIWEVAIKHAKGGDIPMSGTELLQTLQATSVVQLAISHDHAAAAGNLPRHHGDPFDRMLIAQAQIEGMAFVTADRALAAYGDHVIVAA
jgi:PIN domain nuclease of toxin-antitoxin system